jgi:hypothetical protein
VHCAKTLTLASGRGNGALQFCVGQLLPGLITLVGQASATKREPTEQSYATLVEVLKTFVGLYGILAAEHRASARLALVLSDS